MVFTNAAITRDFVLAGDATVTLESERTGAWFTYRIRQAKDKRTGELTKRWFISLMTGPDNEGSFSYMGLLDLGRRDVNYLAPGGPLMFRRTDKSRIGEDAPSYRGFIYFWTAVASGRMPFNMKVRHDGRCGRCHRKLTTPESLDRGIGPECATRMGIAT